MRKLCIATMAMLSVISTPSAANDEQSARAKIEEGRALLASGESEQAIVRFREAVQLNPVNAAPHNALGSLLNSSGHYAEALSHADTAVRLDPDDLRYRYNRGVVLAEHGRFEEAKADFDAALAANPQLAYGWLERGAAKLSLGDLSGARSDWQRAAQVDPGLIWTSWYEAMGNFVEGRFSTAAAGFDAVAEAEPGFTPAKLWQAVAHARAGREFAAEKADNSDWPAPLLDFWRGAISADRLMQIAAEDQVSGDSRRSAEAYFFLAQRALVYGDRKGAANHLREALAISSPRHA